MRRIRPAKKRCAAVAAYEEVKILIKEAIEFHLAGMIEDGDDIPQPSSFVEYIETQIPA